MNEGGIGRFVSSHCGTTIKSGPTWRYHVALFALLLSWLVATILPLKADGAAKRHAAAAVPLRLGTGDSSLVSMIIAETSARKIRAGQLETVTVFLDRTRVISIQQLQSRKGIAKKYVRLTFSFGHVVAKEGLYVSSMRHIGDRIHLSVFFSRRVKYSGRHGSHVVNIHRTIFTRVTRSTLGYDDVVVPIVSAKRNVTPLCIAPTISQVEFERTGATLQIIMTGNNFGSKPRPMPFTGNLPGSTFVYSDNTGHLTGNGTTVWAAGYGAASIGASDVWINYHSWTNQRVELQGFAHSYGQSGNTASINDRVTLTLRNDCGEVSWAGILRDGVVLTSAIPTAMAVVQVTPTSAATDMPSSTATISPTPTTTMTAPLPVATASATFTSIPTATATVSSTSTAVATSSPTNTVIVTGTATSTPTP